MNGQETEDLVVELGLLFLIVFFCDWFVESFDFVYFWVDLVDLGCEGGEIDLGGFLCVMGGFSGFLLGVFFAVW